MHSEFATVNLLASRLASFWVAPGAFLHPVLANRVPQDASTNPPPFSLSQSPNNKSLNGDIPLNAIKFSYSIATAPAVPTSTPRPMKRLLLLALTAATLLSATTTANAHHDGDHKHQDTTTNQGFKK